jgi:hypothetical protein
MWATLASDYIEGCWITQLFVCPTFWAAYDVIYDPESEHSQWISDMIDDAIVAHVSLFCYHFPGDTL